MKELETPTKNKSKNPKIHRKQRRKNKAFQREAKSQAENNTIYEKRWKEKIKQTQKELNALKKELKPIEDNPKKLSKQKTQENSN